MEITFKIQETLKNILNEVQYSNDYWVSQNHSKPQHGYNSLELADLDFDSWATVNFWGEYYEGLGFTNIKTIQITTAWSGFSYEIEEYEGGTYVKYEGAYKGLLEQALLPTLTPVDVLSAQVKSSISPAKTLKEYAQDRVKFMEFKKSIGGDVGYHLHPRCVHNALSEFPSLR